MGTSWLTTEPPPSGAIHGVAQRARPHLSEALWDLDFADHFPLEVSTDGVSVGVGTPADVLEFFGEHHSSLFGASEGSRFWSGDGADAKARYLERVCDIFVFSHEGRSVGVFIGNPIDWSTYYIRMTAFVREYQGKALYARFLSKLFALLSSAGVSRVEAETAPSNLSCVSALVRQRFMASGSVLTERWGALTRFTKYLDSGPESVFLEQFCHGGEIHRRGRRHGGDA